MTSKEDLYRSLHRARLEAISQVLPHEHGPSNRLAQYPGLITALAMDLELSCSTYRHIQEITEDLNDYEKYLLWCNLSPELIAKVKRLKAQANHIVFPVSPYATTTTAARPKPAPKPRARAKAGAMRGRN